LGNLEEGSSPGDFERWTKGTVGMGRLPLKKLYGGGLGVGELLHWGPGRYVKKGSRYWHLSP